jgi:hypothetical protein
MYALEKGFDNTQHQGFHIVPCHHPSEPLSCQFIQKPKKPELGVGEGVEELDEEPKRDPPPEGEDPPLGGLPRLLLEYPEPEEEPPKTLLGEV